MAARCPAQPQLPASRGRRRSACQHRSFGAPQPATAARQRSETTCLSGALMHIVPRRLPRPLLPAGYCVRQACAPGCDAAEAHSQPAQRGGGAGGPQVRRPARPELILGEPGALTPGVDVRTVAYFCDGLLRGLGASACMHSVSMAPPAAQSPRQRLPPRARRTLCTSTLR